MFESSASVVPVIHAKKYIAIAYISLGSCEDRRPDHALLPESMKGNRLNRFTHSWLDARASSGALAILQDIMSARIVLAESKVLNHRSGLHRDVFRQ